MSKPEIACEPCGKCGQSFPSGRSFKAHTNQCDPAQDRKIADEYDRGSSVETLAKRHNLFPETVRSAIKRCGLKLRPPGGRASFQGAPPLPRFYGDRFSGRCGVCLARVVGEHDCAPVRTTVCDVTMEGNEGNEKEEDAA